MKISFLKGFLPVLALVLAIFTACNKDAATSSEVTDATDQALYSVQDRGGLGRFGCFDLVFPVTVSLPDSSTATVNSYEEMRDAIKAYFEANGIPAGGGIGGNRPHLNFVYPIDVITADGATVTVNDQQELRALRAECVGTFGNHGWQGHGSRPMVCFDIVFPLTISFPDGTTQSVANRQALKTAIRTWKQANPTATERPQIAFPITVKMKDDGTEVTVNSREELRQLREDCE